MCVPGDQTTTATFAVMHFSNFKKNDIELHFRGQEVISFIVWGIRVWSEGSHIKWMRGNGRVSSLYVTVRIGAMAMANREIRQG